MAKARKNDGDKRIREIPYNYTSFSDYEIVQRFLGDEGWVIIEKLRGQRKTGRSARMLFEVLGDMWVVVRNPFIQEDLIQNRKRRRLLLLALYHRLDQFKKRANGNELALELMELAQKGVAEFQRELQEQKQLRRRVYAELSKVTRSVNIDFTGLARVSHATDATDLRVEMPFVVIAPDSEHEIAGIVRACIDLGLTIIPRGGGTGYAASSVPLYAKTAMINTEKLIFRGDLVGKDDPDNPYGIGYVHAGAGLVTKDLADYAESKGHVFAVDPTSASSSTLGGNIAMNSGGKKAVAWGTAIDNLLKWRMVDANGEWLEVERMDRNFGRLHLQEDVEFRIRRFANDGVSEKRQPQFVQLPGSVFRKAGLGKDVTNKVMGGLPGVQKEGCDGIVTSAIFMVHEMPAYMRTVCLEFFGDEMSQAAEAIREVKDYFDGQDGVLLTALEHLDERYLYAINYNVKSSGGEMPKMALLADLGSDSAKRADAYAKELIQIIEKRGARGFVASTPEARKNFWEDRTRTAAIARHTNAFKLNEDVVIPIQRLGEYTNEVERLNIEFSIKNKLELIDNLVAYLQSDMPELKKMRSYVESSERDKIILDKKNSSTRHLKEIRSIWQKILRNLDKPAADLGQVLVDHFGLERLPAKTTVLELLLQRRFRISVKEDIMDPLEQTFGGSELESVRAKLHKIHGTSKASRLFIATHMHAGDGNVHTNIPVNSNDYQMMTDAGKIVERVMQVAKNLDGVISGEHGIGLTKYRFWDKRQRQEFANYMATVDPEGHFNKGKLLDESKRFAVYTPSLRLLKQEALILEQSQLRELNDDVRNCLRCGKCKPVCSTHVPRANLLYSPRNKILGAGQLIEAFLYEEQTRRGISLRHFDELNDIADHCTVCRKCLNPCPVDIDYGEVTIKIRNVLEAWQQKRKNMGAKLAVQYLTLSDYRPIQAYYKGLFRHGFRAQKAASRLLRMLEKPVKGEVPKPTHGRMAFKTQVRHSLNKPLPSVPKNTLRGLLGLGDPRYVPIIRNPDKVNEESEAVFFFPGCGAERLHSQIGLATLAMLYHLGVQTVVPPKFLCCGYPQKTSGQFQEAKRIITQNSVLFHRIANTLNYMDIKHVVIDCGTCLAQLETYELDNIFPGNRLIDIHEFLAEKGVSAKDSLAEENYIYHDPCHSPMKYSNVNKILQSLTGLDVPVSDRCCGEAGTLSVSRPDIATQVRFRKELELKKNLIELNEIDMSQNNNPLVSDEHYLKKESRNTKILTSCPVCLQGLNRYRDDIGVRTTYIVIELAEKLLGKNWQKDFIKEAKARGIERVLL